ncbi:MAG: peptidoglycan-binding protein, partial [Proteobacteria bacterium]|nr:peptidoglycan-binding protein [Pseudomonadota bacterium]
LPDDQIAILMIFKAYEKVSYALLMETSAAVKVGDRASSP